jgi:DNA gyrase/topoisomerase IV subunit A
MTDLTIQLLDMIIERREKEQIVVDTLPVGVKKTQVDRDLFTALFENSMTDIETVRRYVK